MKNYILLSLLIFSITICQAQILNFADSVSGFSSQWSSGSWSSDKALGFPTVYPQHSDNSQAWASRTTDSDREFIELYFENATKIDGIWIYETYNPGAVDTVYVKNPATDLWEIVWSDSAFAQPKEARIFKIEFETTTFAVSEVRIALNSPDVEGWNEIDAVAVIDNSMGINDMNTCEGDSILFREMYYTENTQIFDTLDTEFFVLELFEIKVHSHFLQALQIEIFQGDSALIQGVYRKEAGVFIDTLTSVFGCDSLAGARLVVKSTVVNDNPAGFEEHLKIVSQDRVADDSFGSSVAISGDYAIVGARGQDFDESSSNSATSAGAAYIFKKDSQGNWTQLQKIVASDRESNDFFGANVSIDGNLAIVSASGQDTDENGDNNKSSAGAAYIFERDASDTWLEVQKLVASDRSEDDFFGSSVGISENYAVVGAMSEDDDEEDGGDDAGSAYIFERDPNTQTWNQTKKIVASDRSSDSRFGIAAAISGDHVLIGAHRKNAQRGGAYVFRKDMGGADSWGEVAVLEASDGLSEDWFGISVSIAADFALVGAYNNDVDGNGDNFAENAGAAYIFQKDQGGEDEWGEVTKLVPSSRMAFDFFGESVSISENYALVGASGQDYDVDGENLLDGAGAAYVFRKDAFGTWYEAQKLVASDREQDDDFGEAVALYGGQIVVCAENEDENQNGDDFLEDAGSIYSFEFDKGDQEITFELFDQKTYGSDPFDLESVVSSTLPLSFESSDETVATISDRTITIHRAGSTVITASQSGDDEFNAAPDVEQTLVVEKAALTVTAEDKSKVYGEVDPELTYTYEGFVNGENPSVLDSEPSGSATTVTAVDAGTYTIAVTQDGTDDNYAFTYVDGTFIIEKLTLGATVDNQMKIYGEANPTFTISYSGFVNGDDASDLDASPVVATQADVTSSVGTYSLVGSGGTDNNYNFDYADGTLTIQKATLMVAAADQVRTYGEANPTFTMSYSTFLNEDDASDLDTPPVVSTEANTSSSVGMYSLMVSGGADDNYDFTYEAGTLTVQEAVLLVTAHDHAKIYGEVNPELTLTYSGFVAGDDASVLDTAPIVTTEADMSSFAGVYSLIPSGGIASNYDFDYVEGALTISKANITATADDQMINEGESIPELTVSYTGFVNDDDVSDLDIPPMASTIEDSSIPGTFDIVLTDGSDNNYEFTLVNGSLTINEVLGIDESSLLKIYPNPVINYFTAEIQRDEIVEVYDNRGILHHSSKSVRRIDVGTLQSGIYLVLLKDRNGEVKAKSRFIKQ